MDRHRVATGTEWESTVGYSRAVRAGDRTLVAGTTATDDEGDPVAPGDSETRTRRAIATVYVVEIGAEAVVPPGRRSDERYSPDEARGLMDEL